MRSGAVVCPASLCGIVSAAGLYGDTRTGSISGPSARRHPGSAWFSRSRLIDRLPLPLASACLHPEPAPDPIRGRLAAPRSGGCGSPVGFLLHRQRPEDARRPVGECNRDQLQLLRVARQHPRKHGSCTMPCLTAFRITDIAPTTNRRLRSRWPIFEIFPSRGLPAVVCWRGTRPSQAEKSRPRRKLASGGARAWIARAEIGPTPARSSPAPPLRPAGHRRATPCSAPRSCDRALRSAPAAARPARAPSPEASSPGPRSPAPACGHEPDPSGNHPELRKMAPECIDRLRALADRKIANPELHHACLLFLALHRHKVHGRTLRRLADRFRIRHVVLLPLHIRLHIDRRDQANLMTQLADLTAPVMRAPARFHRHRATRLRRQERQNLPTRQLPAERHRSIRSRAVKLIAVLRQVDPDDVNFDHGCLLPIGGYQHHHHGTSRCRRMEASNPSGPSSQPSCQFAAAELGPGSGAGATILGLARNAVQSGRIAV